MVSPLPMPCLQLRMLAKSLRVEESLRVPQRVQVYQNR
jgi:hypothetical protein